MNYKYNERFVKAFGEHVRKLRQERGYSMRQFATMADMEYKQLSLIEHGMVNATISTASALADALGVTVPELFSFRMPVKK